MFEKLVRKDNVLGDELFLVDEVKYNLIHRISESDNSTCLKTAEGELIFAQSTGLNAWVWVSPHMAEDKKESLIEKLLAHLAGHVLPGITGTPAIAEQFAEIYAKRHAVQYRAFMSMESYCCPEVAIPLGVKGTIQLATRQNVEVIAQFLAGFSEDAYGLKVDPSSQMPAAEGLIATGGLSIWTVGDEPVSMANIAHCSPRHARINAVYTPPAMRKKGYASALVAEVSSSLLKKGLVPMLYANMINPDSNKVYRNIGFISGGVVADIRFEVAADVVNISAETPFKTGKT